MTGTSYILIMHETKGGEFKGDSYYAHLNDIQLKAEKGIISVEKNRYRLPNIQNEIYLL